MFDWLYSLLGAMLSFFNSITGSYALALLFYALVFKIVFLPFSIKQQKNQIKLAELTPKIALIRAKYKGRTDQPTLQKQQEEIMELQQKEGYSPFSGCLPLLIQLPLIMLLYTVIQNPISYIASTTQDYQDYNAHYSEEGYEIPESILEVYGEKDLYEFDQDGNKTTKRKALNNVEFLYDRYKLEGKARNQISLINAIFNDTHGDDGNLLEDRVQYIKNVGIEYSSIPDFRLFGVNLAETPDIMNLSILVLIPFLAAISSWLSMYLTRKLNGTAGSGSPEQDQQTAASMKIMDLMMPLMTLFIAFGFSGMLGLYWIYQSLLGLGQSFILAKAMPLPKYTEEELREMRRQEREAEKAARAAAKSGRKHKSLHYIDEDDYDELPDAPTSTEGGKKNGGVSTSDMPEIKD